ncbi:glycine rich domain-containing protein, partial [Segatella albensis]|uniref:glycine rich domain-containing protein n=1 Tax=Segatella albensis TaxID=77768 RepID=UPI000563429C
MQTFTAPISGDYKLEVWGASGGNYDDQVGIGGKGGYSKGIGYILENTIISICVGGIGRFNGYNGGGDPNKILGGGGATHIAQNNRGTLQDYINNKDEVYIVAGGGGGCDTHGIGGYGGGENGGDGIGVDEGSSYL